MIQTLIAKFACWLGRCQRPASEAKRLVPLALAVTESPSLPEVIATIAEAEAGKNIREVGGNNRGADVERYQRATWLMPGAWPWCAAFVCWVVFQALEVTGIKGWPRPRTAGAYDFEAWADGKYGKVPWKVMPVGTVPRRGDLLTFPWSHIGICVDYDARSKTVYSVEGNTGPAKNARDAASVGGDGVYRKQHGLGSVRLVIRYVG